MYKDFIVYRARSEIKAEFRKGYLGLLWWVLEPILYMCVFYFLFGVALNLRGGVENIPSLLCGLVAWKWFSTGCKNSFSSVYANSNLIGQVYLPKYVFPSVTMLTSFMKYLFILSIFILFLLFTGAKPALAWLSLPILVLAQGMFMIGVSFIIAAIMPFVPDIKFIVDNGMLLLFFLSGIILDISRLPEEVRQYFYLNPVAVLVTDYRMALIKGEWPEWQPILAIIGASAVLIFFGCRLLKKYDKVYAKRLFV